ncbi:MAG: heavy-metal-associated domain-containing protein [Candidatus Peregrinibacteria bacterium]|nr:heavy-metal-associated domain-containing protein [Candidatus Peregrinibacteria bacterium]
MKTTVSIPGIHCEACKALIEDVSSEFPSIKNVDIDIAKKVVTLEHTDDLDMQKWTQEVESLDEKYKVHHS